MTTARQSDFISTARDKARQLWEAIYDLKTMQAEWNALDYANTLLAFEGSNSELDAADIGAVVFGTTDAILTDVLAVGHATNLAKLL